MSEIGCTENSTLHLSRSKSTSAAPPGDSATSKADESNSSGPKLEAHILVHVLQLYTTLLSISSSETNELFASNLENTTSGDETGGGGGDPETPSLDSNISAVLRRSVPALRILGRWLNLQMDYISRLEKRVFEKEKKLRAKLRSSGGTSSLEEAQRSQQSSGGSTADDAVMSSQVLEATLDGFWNAFADYSNSIKLAFPNPRNGNRLPVLEEDVWLEEDVECLGFAPLRSSKKSGGMGDTREGARRVGRDVHPNQEVLMRIEEAQRLAEEMADLPVSLSLYDTPFLIRMNALTSFIFC